MPTMTDWTAIGAAFRAPFPPEQVKQRPGGHGKEFSYVDARDVENRLDEVVGPDAWTDEYEVVDPARMGLLCRLTVLGVTKSGVGYPNNAIGAINAKGDRIDSDEPGKDAESDALKRAAVKFGIGRHLYDNQPSRNGQRPAGPSNPAAGNGRSGQSRYADTRRTGPLPAEAKKKADEIRADLDAKKAAREEAKEGASPNGKPPEVPDLTANMRKHLRNRASELAHREGKGQTDLQVIAQVAKAFGVTCGVSKRSIDALTVQDMTTIGQGIKTELERLKSASEEPEEKPAMTRQTF